MKDAAHNADKPARRDELSGFLHRDERYPAGVLKQIYNNPKQKEPGWWP